MTDRPTLRGSVHSRPVSGHHFSLESSRKKDTVTRVFHSEWTCFFLAISKRSFLPYCSPREGHVRDAPNPDVSQKFANTIAADLPARTRTQLSRDDDGRGSFRKRPGTLFSKRELYPWDLFVRRHIDSYTGTGINYENKSSPV